MLVDNKRNTSLVILLAALTLVLAACGGAEDTHSSSASTGDGGSGQALSLVAFSTPQVVYDEIIPDFRETPEGKGIRFKQSFGASGDQSRAVEGGLKADIVHLSLAPDVTRLVDAGLVADDWQTKASDGLVAASVVSFAVRKGNPKGIKTWDDLLKPGVEVVTPNPFSSGGAKWNLLAAYGAKGDKGKDADAGLAYIRELITEHVKVQDKSAREALQTFLGGKGDVLIAYENEAVTAQKKGEELDYVVPDDTLRIDTPIALTKAAPREAQSFLDFLLTEPAQQKFADWGYRPVDEAVAKRNADKFKVPSGLFTIDELGGWDKLNDALFDPEKGSIAKIEEDAGVSTAK